MVLRPSESVSTVNPDRLHIGAGKVPALRGDLAD